MYKGKKKVREIYTGVRGGRNLWDEVWEKGHITRSGNTLSYDSSDNNISSKNYIQILPGTTYYFHQPISSSGLSVFFYDENYNFVLETYKDIANGISGIAPDNARYLKFSTNGNYGTSYNNDICINLSDPDFNGTYEPFQKELKRVKKVVKGGHVMHSTPYLLGSDTTVDGGGSTTLHSLDRLNEFDVLGKEGQSTQNALVGSGYTQTERLYTERDLGDGSVIPELPGRLGIGGMSEVIEWNQLYANKSVTHTSPSNVEWYGISNSLSIPSGHRLLFVFDIKPTSTNSSDAFIVCHFYRDSNGYNYTHTYSQGIKTNANTHVEFIVNLTHSIVSTEVYIRPKNTLSGTVTEYKYDNFQCFDLTQMFGAGNEPSSPDAFKRLFPRTYYPYEKGEKRRFTGLGAIVENQQYYGELSADFADASGGVINFHKTGVGESFGVNSTFRSYKNHKYYIGQLPSNVNLRTHNSNLNSGYGGDVIVTCSADNTDRLGFAFDCGAGTYSFRPQLFDLTQMYGPGNEPQSISEFKASHPLSYYPYKSGQDFRATQRLGMVWNQLVDISNWDDNTNCGITYSNKGTYINVSGTATTYGYCTQYPITVIGGHKYILQGCPSGGSANESAGSTYDLRINNNENYVSDIGNGTIFTAISGSTSIYIRVMPQYTANNVKFYPQLIDLTLLYGEGNEPQTVSEFRADFPLPYYAYNPGEILGMGGGRVKWNQILNGYHNTSHTNYPVTVTTDTITWNLTAGDYIRASLYVQSNNSEQYTAGHKYYCSYNVYSEYEIGNLCIRILGSFEGLGNSISVGNNSISKITTASTTKSCALEVFNDTPLTATKSGKIVVKNLILIDLTTLFGPGNEPQSTQEFETFLDTYRPYIIKSWPQCSEKCVDLEDGREIRWNQLATFNTINTTVSGVTIKTICPGTYELSGTTTNTASTFVISDTKIELKDGHTYYCWVSNDKFIGRSHVYPQIYRGSTRLYDWDVSSGNERIKKITGGDCTCNDIKLAQSSTDKSQGKVSVALIDLTLLFGKGLEPQTTGEFETFLRQHREAIIRQTSTYFPYCQCSDLCLPVKVSGESRNIWDEEWEVGYIDTTTGNFIATGQGSQVVSKNFIEVNPNKIYSYKMSGDYRVYYYDKNKSYLSNSLNASGVLPSECKYIKFLENSGYGSTYNHDICISESSALSSTYTPHESSTLCLDLSAFDVEVAHVDGSKSILGGLKKAGEVMDEIVTDGSGRDVCLIQRVGVVDLGNLDWVADSTDAYSIKTASILPNSIGHGTDTLIGNITVSRIYSPVNVQSAETWKTTDKTLGIWTDNIIYLKNSSYNNTNISTFKSSLDHVYLYYELKTPIYTYIPRKSLEAYSLGKVSLDIPDSSYLPSLPGFPCTLEYRYSGDSHQVPGKRVSDGVLGLVSGDTFLADTSKTLRTGKTITSPTPEAPWKIENESAGIEVWSGYKCPAYSLVKNGDFRDGTNGWSVYSGTHLQINGVKDGIISTTIKSIGYWFEMGIHQSISVTTSHVYFAEFYARCENKNVQYGIEIGAGIECNTYDLSDGWKKVNCISNSKSNNSTFIIKPGYCSVGDIIEYKDITLIDLTLLYGAGNEPQTVSAFKETWPENFYPYYPSPLTDWRTGKEITRYYSPDLEKSGAKWLWGLNMWDEKWEVGDLDGAGNKISSTTTYRSKNLIEVDSSCEYYVKNPQRIQVYQFNKDKEFINQTWKTNQTFTIESSCRFLQFIQNKTSYSNDICISQSSPFNGTYEPYVDLGPGYYIGSHRVSPWTYTGELPKIGEVCDEVDYARGKYIQRIGKVDLGTLSWTRMNIYLNPTYHEFTTMDLASTIKKPNKVSDTQYIVLCDKYLNFGVNSFTANDVVNFSITVKEDTGEIVLQDHNVESTEDIKMALGGVYAYYVLSSPIIHTFDPGLQRTSTMTLENYGKKPLSLRGRVVPEGYKEVKVKQLVKNGDFGVGLDGWSRWSSEVCTYTLPEPYTLRITSVKTSNYNYEYSLRSSRYITLPAGHKGFFSVDVYSNGISGTYVHELLSGVAVSIGNPVIAGKWCNVCGIITGTGYTSSILSRITPSSGSYNTIGNYVDHKNVVLYDLTDLGLDTILDTPGKCREYFGTRYPGYGEVSILVPDRYVK